jgi:hypothetical protein
VSRLAPEAFFDLKTGVKGILASWVSTLQRNVDILATGIVPVFTLTC